MQSLPSQQNKIKTISPAKCNIKHSKSLRPTQPSPPIQDSQLHQGYLFNRRIRQSTAGPYGTSEKWSEVTLCKKQRKAAQTTSNRKASVSAKHVSDLSCCRDSRIILIIVLESDTASTDNRTLGAWHTWWNQTMLLAILWNMLCIGWATEECTIFLTNDIS